MIKEGWLCPQCKRVWAPHIDRCLTCEKVATGGYGIDKCSCYFDGECWGTKEREKTDCGGDSKKCDKYFKKKDCDKIKSVTYNTGGEVSYDTFNDRLDGWECINNGEIKSYFKKSDYNDESEWR